MASPRRLRLLLQVYIFENGEWAVDTEHAAKLDEQWDLEVVREAAYAALAAVGRSEMHFRPPEEQNEHKVGLCWLGGRLLPQPAAVGLLRSHVLDLP